MSDSRIQTVVDYIEEAKTKTAQANALLDDARCLIADMTENSGGLLPHSAWYLNSARNDLNDWINSNNRALFGIDTTIEWLQKLPEAEAS